MKQPITTGMVVAGLCAPAILVAPQAGWSQQIEEIIVTTRRREENLQDVPISVSTLSAQDIRRQGISNIRDVAKYSPGIEFDEGYGAQDTRIVIRGLSATRGRSNAAFLVDGVDYTGEAVQVAGAGFSVSQRLIDVERVEVVKGTQAALYGRSAFAGAIQYISKSPNLESMEADISVDANDESQYEVTAAIGGPVTDNLGLRLNGLWYDEEGFYDNVITGDDVGGAEGWGLALTGLWQPSEDWSFRTRIAYSEDEYTPGAQARAVSNTLVDLRDNDTDINGDPLRLVYTSGLGATIGGNYPTCEASSTPADGALTSCLGQPKVLVSGLMPSSGLEVKQAEDPNNPGNDFFGTEVDTLSFNLTVNWDLDAGRISSITGYSDLEAAQSFDSNWDAMDPSTAYYPGEWDDPVNLPGQFTTLDGTWTDTIDAGCGFTNCSPYLQFQDQNNDTTLFSQELRFATAFDGPLNFTVGGLWWNEDVDQVTRSITIAPAVFRGFSTAIIDMPSGSEIKSTAVDTRTDQAIADWMAANPGEPLPPNLLVFPRNIGRETDHWSIYGLVEWQIDSQWKLSLEARYVDEDLEVIGPICTEEDALALQQLSGINPSTLPDGTVTCNTQTYRGGSSTGISNANGTLPVGTYINPITTDLLAESEGDYVTPKVTLEWMPTDDMLWYAYYAKGKKPGGVSTLTAGGFFKPEELTFAEETLDAYEIGGKTTWLDGSLILNGAVFFQDYTDKQVGVSDFDPILQTTVGRIRNAGEAEIWGIELDATWRATENLTLSGAYTWLDAEYVKFDTNNGSPNTVARLFESGQGGCLLLEDPDPTDGEVGTCQVSYTGLDIEDVPDNSFVGLANYTAPLPGTSLEWFGEISAIFTDERWMDETNIKKLDSYWLFDFRAGLTSPSWDLLFYVDNVFDDDTPKTGVDVGSQVGTLRQAQFPPGPLDGVIVTLPDPRLFGVRFTYRYGG